jgi:hypothetical protein
MSSQMNKRGQQQRTITYFWLGPALLQDRRHLSINQLEGSVDTWIEHFLHLSAVDQKS